MSIKHKNKLLTPTARTTLLAAMLLLVATSCRNSNSRQQPVRSISNTKEALMRINKSLNSADKDRIEHYIKNASIEEMNVSQTGLYHLVYGEANGKQVETNDIVELEYSISLLDSTTCYSSKVDGNKRFKVGQGGVESGLEEGILLMKQGQKAKLILPPHLAHGLVGDGKHIPARAIIVYDIKLILVEPSNQPKTNTTAIK